MPNKQDGWLGVDLDGTLANYTDWKGDETIIGEPIPLMVQKVKMVIEQGYTVKIFTARVCQTVDPFRNVERIRKAIEDWTEKHIGTRLEVTNEKDYGMIEMWDDRCRQVVKNTGEFVKVQE